MYEFLTKKGEMIAFGLGALLVAITLFSVFPGLEEFNLLPEDQQKTSDLFNLGIILTRALAVVTVAIMLLAIIYNLVANFKDSKGIIAVVVGVLILMGIFYATSEAETSGIVAEAVEEFSVGETASKLISAAIKTTGVLVGGSVLAFVVMELWNAIK